MSTTRSNSNRKAQKSFRKESHTTKNVNREKVASESQKTQGSHQIVENARAEVRFVDTGKARRAGITKTLLEMVMGHGDTDRSGLLGDLSEKIREGAYKIDPARIADKLERAFAV